MPSKELLIQHLKELISIVESSDSERVALRRIRREGLFYPFWDEEIEYRLRRIDQKVDALLERPALSCQMTSEEGSNVLRLLTGISGSCDQDKKYIKKKSHSNDWMIITDPYFLQWDGPNKAFKTEKNYTQFIIDFIPHDLKKLELFILPGPNKRIFKKFNDKIRSRGTNVSYWQTSEIHDRTIIRDDNTATLMGTSFGGYSNKLSFVLEIPRKDLEQFMAELVRIRNEIGNQSKIK